MDALSLLKSDHRKVESLFKKIESTRRDPKRRLEIIRQVVRELSVHAAVEEEAFYPAIKERHPRLRELVLRSLEEHRVAKWLLYELDKAKADDERLLPKAEVLMENIRKHVDEEENDLFPAVQRVLPEEELAQLGLTLERLKKTSPTHPHPRAPDEPPGNLVAGIAAAALDAGRDLVRSATRRRAGRVKGQRRASASPRTARRRRSNSGR